MPNRDEQHHRSARDVPEVGRPRGAIWRSLQADGVVWEGQVLLVGGEVDLAARLIVTHRRVVIVRGGDIALEIPRGWLRQEPVLRRDGVLELFVATPESNPFDEPMSVPLRMREGNAAAGHIIAMLAPGGVRRIAPDTLSAIERARESATTPSYGGFWDGADPIPVPKRDAFLVGSSGLPDELDSESNDDMPLADLTPMEPPDRLIRLASHPQRPFNGAGYGIAGLAPRDQRRSPWSLVLRLCALMILLATAAALGAGRLNLHLPGSTPGTGAVLIAPTPTTADATGEPNANPEVEPASSAADSALSPEELTAVAAGVGGPATQPTDEAATDEATAAATEPAAPTTAAVVAPTKPAIPTPAPPSTPAAELTATLVPAEAPAAATANASASPPAIVPSTPELAAVSQPAAVDPDSAPAQEIVVGSVRLAIPTALRAESLPKYGLPPGSGEWVLLRAELANEGDSVASVAMSDFRLFDRGTGTVADLDSGVGVIAGLAGMAPARGAGDVISLDAGDSTETLLLYLLPPGSSDDLALLVGQSSLDLAPSLEAGSAEPAEKPGLVEATVTEVLNGDRIAVDIGGLPSEVRYLGMRAPVASDCYTAEATAANEHLVAGKQVWLERQATDAAEDNVLMRDVWVADAQGEKVLVAARLLEAGAGSADSVAPDTRYASWLAASAALGRSHGAGMWGACAEGGALG